MKKVQLFTPKPFTVNGKVPQPIRATVYNPEQHQNQSLQQQWAKQLEKQDQQNRQPSR